MTAVMFIVFLVCLVLSFPVAIAMGIAAITPGIVDPTFSADVVYIIRAMVVGIDSTPILAIPLFILSGTIMAQGGISGKLFDVFAYFLGKRTGGLPCAVIVTCLFYGAISGSGPATCAAVGAMTVPLLVSLGYEKSFCSAIVATAGGLGLIIPPSISFVNYALVTGTSVTSLFTAGILPGCLIALFLMAYCYFYCRSHGEDKAKIAKNCAALHSRSLGQVFKEGFWALLSPVIILGGIYSGIFSPTEAACISVVYAVIVSVWIYRSVSLKRLWSLILESVQSCAPLCALLVLATAFSRVLTGNFDLVPAADADRSQLRHRSGAPGRDHRLQPDHRTGFAALWIEPVCRQLHHRLTRDGNRKESDSLHSDVPNRPDFDHFYPADFSLPDLNGSFSTMLMVT